MPLLRKDFFVDPWQVIEARTHGADAILIILRAGRGRARGGAPQQAEDLEHGRAVEVHTEDELRRALRSDSR